MIRLGLRLTLNGGKESLVRLVVTAFAVALGVGMLLVTLAGMNALGSQNARAEWLNTVTVGPSGQVLTTPQGRVELRGAGTAGGRTRFGGISAPICSVSETIDRVDVAITGPHSPVLPGIAHVPGPGQFYASPALSELLRSTPGAELGDRFPGKQVGTIGPAALPSPNSLIIVVGYTARQLSRAPDAAEVTAIQNGPTNNIGPAGYTAGGLQAILAIGALAFCFRS